MSHNFHILSKVGVGIMEITGCLNEPGAYYKIYEDLSERTKSQGTKSRVKQEKLDVVDVFQGLRRYTNKANKFGCTETTACSDLFWGKSQVLRIISAPRVYDSI